MKGDSQNASINSHPYLVFLLIVTPIVVMAAMGFDKWDANEGLICSVALVADIAIFLAYRFKSRRLST